MKTIKQLSDQLNDKSNWDQVMPIISEIRRCHTYNLTLHQINKTQELGTMLDLTYKRLIVGLNKQDIDYVKVQIKKYSKKVFV